MAKSKPKVATKARARPKRRAAPVAMAETALAVAVAPAPVMPDHLAELERMRALRSHDAQRIRELEVKLMQLRRDLEGYKRRLIERDQQISELLHDGHRRPLILKARKAVRKRLKRLYNRLIKPAPAIAVPLLEPEPPPAKPLTARDRAQLERVENPVDDLDFAPAGEAAQPINGALAPPAASAGSRLRSLIEGVGGDFTGVKVERFAPLIVKSLTPAETATVLDAAKRRGLARGLALLEDAVGAKADLPVNALTYLRRARAVVDLADNDTQLPAHAVPLPPVPGNRRVLYLLHMRGPMLNNGYVTRTQLVLRAMRSAGLAPEAVTRLGFPNDLAAFRTLLVNEREELDGASFHLLKDAGGGVLRRPVDEYIEAYARSVAAAAGQLRPAVFHAASNFMNGLAAVKAGRQLRVPSIYEVRGLWEVTKVSKSVEYENTYRYKMEQRLELQAVREADRVITISGPLKDYFADQGTPRDKLFVVPNGIDVNEAKPPERDPRLFDKLGWPRDSIVIGYVGSLVDYEGIDLVLDAVAKLRRAGHARLRALIVGGGAEADILKSFAHRLELGPNAVFTGRLPRDEALAYYSLIDIAPFARRLLPVTKLVPPIKPFEAMAAAKCVVVSDVPALAEIVAHDKTGLVFKADDSEALAAGLASLVAHPDRLSAIAAAGYKWVFAERSLDRIAQMIGEAYRGLTAPAP
jgi:glycosyltransferase involved in cell wall biosynthesis